MWMIRSAFAVAAVFSVIVASASATDLQPADRPIGEVVDHYVDAVLRRGASSPRPPPTMRA